MKMNACLQKLDVATKSDVDLHMPLLRISMPVIAMLVVYNETPCLKIVTCAKCFGNAEVTDLMSRLLCNDAHCTLKLIQMPTVHPPTSCILSHHYNDVGIGYWAKWTALAAVQSALGHQAHDVIIIKSFFSTHIWDDKLIVFPARPF